MFRPSEDVIELTVADEALATLEQVGTIPKPPIQLELIMLRLFHMFHPGLNPETPDISRHGGSFESTETAKSKRLGCRTEWMRLPIATPHT